MSEETVIWEGHPSNVVNFWWFVSCLLIIPIPYVFWKWLETKKSQYIVTTERIRYREGVFSKSEEEIELYRVRDYTLSEPFFLRLFGKGDIHLTTSDKSHPTFVLRAVPDPEGLRDKIRAAVEKLRLEKNVREIDYE